MTVINTNYSSLEDAWGDNFDPNSNSNSNSNGSKKKKNKKILSSSVDPLCELYGKRYRKTKKPYGTKSSTPLDDEYIHRYNVYNGEDKRHYYGYKDDDYSKLMNPSRQKTNLLLIDPESEDRCVNVNAIPPIYKKNKKKSNKKVKFVEPEDEDDLYLQNAVSSSQEDGDNDDLDNLVNTYDEAISSKKTNFNRIYSNVYDESEDETETNENDEHENENDKLPNHIEQGYVDTEDEEDSLLISNEVKRKSNVVKNQIVMKNQMDISRERNYLDFIIYILSGFILIFMMEQFVQIGIQMRLR